MNTLLTKLVLTTLLLSIFLCGIAAADELIYIDDVGPQTIGDTFTLTGSADLPAGTVLHIRILPVDDLGKTDISTGPTKEMIWGDFQERTSSVFRGSCIATIKS